MKLPRNTIITGDALEQLRQLPLNSVDCVITSPPYFGLRDYQMDKQLGLEMHVDRWVAALQEVMRQVARALKPTGSVWLNLGDSYSRHNRQGGWPKSLVLGPERLLLALHRDGWIVRNKLIWSKTNPTPSSVDDRLTNAWEPLYLLVRQRRYFFDLNAIRQPHTSRRSATTPKVIDRARPSWAGPLAGNNSGLARLHIAGRAGHPLGRNPTDVWTMATSALRGVHHATFPEGLVERPLRAGCPERVCTTCDQPWRRAEVRTLGHLAVVGDLEPRCGCGTSWRAGLVLDPFIGSGTTAVVAERLNRDWLGVELNPEFVRIAQERIAAARGRPETKVA